MGKPRKVRDVLEITDNFWSLDGLISDLIAIKERIGSDAEEEIIVHEHELFGQKISIWYSRLQTKEEVELEERYKPRKRRKSSSSK